MINRLSATTHRGEPLDWHMTNAEHISRPSGLRYVEVLEEELDRLEHRCDILEAVLREIIAKYKNEYLPTDIAIFSIYEMALRALEDKP